MRTTSRLVVGDARRIPLGDASVHLVVTSPPYPLVEMWDEGFAAADPAVGRALAAGDGGAAFDGMHRALDATWAEVARVLAPGGFACVNVGDAARSIGGAFALWPNHARVGTGLAAAGLTPLPDVLWRKPTNAPNKFMGSGMLPAGAYVTYEHEYVLIFRKGGPRAFPSAADREARSRSAFFWEERNVWFSDVWTDLRGTGQKLDRARARSGAYPLELPWRLVQMYSLYGDVVLDPFAGTGTTLLAAAMSGRSAVGVEREGALADVVAETLAATVPAGRARAAERLAAHRAFVARREAEGRPLKHRNAPHDVPVVTRQEAALELLAPVAAAWEDGALVVEMGRLDEAPATETPAMETPASKRPGPKRPGPKPPGPGATSEPEARQPALFPRERPAS